MEVSRSTLQSHVMGARNSWQGCLQLHAWRVESNQKERTLLGVMQEEIMIDPSFLSKWETPAAVWTMGMIGVRGALSPGQMMHMSASKSPPPLQTITLLYKAHKPRKPQAVCLLKRSSTALPTIVPV